MKKLALGLYMLFLASALATNFAYGCDPPVGHLNLSVGSFSPWAYQGAVPEDISSFNISNTGLGTFSYQISIIYPPAPAPQGWLQVSSSSGTCQYGGQVAINCSFPGAASLPAGEYGATIRVVASPADTPSSIDIPVTLNVYPTVSCTIFQGGTTDVNEGDVEPWTDGQVYSAVVCLSTSLPVRTPPLTATVQYSIVGGNGAVLNEDYEQVIGESPLSGTLQFSGGTTSHILKVRILDDNLYDGGGSREFVKFSLNGATYVVIPTLEFFNSKKLDIVDNESLPTLNISNLLLQLMEGNVGQHHVKRIPVTLTCPSDEAAGVNYAVDSSSTATASGDYTLLDNGLSFPAGTTEQFVEVRSNGDTSLEGDETVIIQLSGATGCTLGQSANTLIIVDDENANMLLSIRNSDGAEQAALDGNGRLFLKDQVTAVAPTATPDTLLKNLILEDSNSIAKAWLAVEGNALSDPTGYLKIKGTTQTVPSTSDMFSIASATGTPLLSVDSDGNLKTLTVDNVFETAMSDPDAFTEPIADYSDADGTSDALQNSTSLLQRAVLYSVQPSTPFPSELYPSTFIEHFETENGDLIYGTDITEATVLAQLCMTYHLMKDVWIEDDVKSFYSLLNSHADYVYDLWNNCDGNDSIRNVSSLIMAGLISKHIEDTYASGWENYVSEWKQYLDEGLNGLYWAFHMTFFRRSFSDEGAYLEGALYGRYCNEEMAPMFYMLHNSDYPLPAGAYSCTPPKQGTAALPGSILPNPLSYPALREILLADYKQFVKWFLQTQRFDGKWFSQNDSSLTYHLGCPGIMYNLFRNDPALQNQLRWAYNLTKSGDGRTDRPRNDYLAAELLEYALFPIPLYPEFSNPPTELRNLQASNAEIYPTAGQIYLRSSNNGQFSDKTEADENTIFGHFYNEGCWQEWPTIDYDPLTHLATVDLFENGTPRDTVTVTSDISHKIAAGMIVDFYHENQIIPDGANVLITEVAETSPSLTFYCAMNGTPVSGDRVVIGKQKAEAETFVEAIRQCYNPDYVTGTIYKIRPKSSAHKRFNDTHFEIRAFGKDLLIGSGSMEYNDEDDLAGDTASGWDNALPCWPAEKNITTTNDSVRRRDEIYVETDGPTTKTVVNKFIPYNDFNHPSQYNLVKVKNGDDFLYPKTFIRFPSGMNAKAEKIGSGTDAYADCYLYKMATDTYTRYVLWAHERYFIIFDQINGEPAREFQSFFHGRGTLTLSEMPWDSNYKKGVWEYCQQYNDVPYNPPEPPAQSTVIDAAPVNLHVYIGNEWTDGYTSVPNEHLKGVDSGEGVDNFEKGLNLVAPGTQDKLQWDPVPGNTNVWYLRSTDDDPDPSLAKPINVIMDGVTVLEEVEGIPAVGEWSYGAISEQGGNYHTIFVNSSEDPDSHNKEYLIAVYGHNYFRHDVLQVNSNAQHGAVYLFWPQKEDGEAWQSSLPNVHWTSTVNQDKIETIGATVSFDLNADGLYTGTNEFNDSWTFRLNQDVLDFASIR